MAAKNVRDLFNSQTGKIQNYTAAAAGDPLLSQLIVNDSPSTAENVASIFIETVSDAAGINFTVTCQFKVGIDSDGNPIYGGAHDVNNDSDTNVFTGNTTFEANLYAQNWWKENDGFIISVAPNAGGAYVIRGSAIVR